MGTVTAFTAERSLEIENASIVDGNVVVDDLVLIRRDGTEINAGNVRGPVGPAGPPGGLGEAPSDGNVYGRKDAGWSLIPITFPYGVLGYSETILAQGPITSITDLVGCSVEVTVAAGRRIKITGQGSVYGTVANDHFVGKIKEGSTDIGYWYNFTVPVAGRDFKQHNAAIISPSAGVHTYKLTMERTIGSGSANMTPSNPNPIFILVEDIGPA